MILIKLYISVINFAMLPTYTASRLWVIRLVLFSFKVFSPGVLIG